MMPHNFQTKTGWQDNTLLRAMCLFAALLSILARSSFAVTYSYDSLNRLTKADYGAGVEISYTYDAAGNRLTYSDIDTTPYVDTGAIQSDGQLRAGFGVSQ